GNGMVAARRGRIPLAKASPTLGRFEFNLVYWEGVEGGWDGVLAVAGAEPVVGVEVLFDGAVEGGVGPGVGAFHVVVFDGVVVDVVEVVVVVVLIADDVFPEAGLPYAAAAGAEAMGGAGLFGVAGVEPGFGEEGFKVGDARGIVGVAGGEGQHQV